MKEFKTKPNIRFTNFKEDWEQRKFIHEVDRVGGVELYESLPNIEYEDISAGHGELISGVKLRNKGKNGIRFKKNDILFGYLRPYLDNRLLADFSGLATGDWWVLRSSHNIDSYIYCLIQTNRFIEATSISTGTKMPRASWDYVSNTNFYFPTNNIEARKIGDVILTLDKTITLHQRKLKEIESLKKTLLNKLFTNNGKKIPYYRFTGFTEDWEQRKMSAVLKVSKERNKKDFYLREHVLSVSREAGTVNQIEYHGRSLAGANISGYKVVQPGQMIYTKSPLKDAPYGIFQNATIEGIVSPLYAVYNSTKNALASFIGLQLKNDNLATYYLAPLVSKGAKNTINITDEGALDGKVSYPSIIEQQRIVEYFTKLDKTITLHHRKLEKLQEMKEYYLKNMFI